MGGQRLCSSLQLTLLTPPPLTLQKEVVYKKKESFFSLEETTFRQPAVLVLQVWDYDRISANDFLGETHTRKRSLNAPSDVGAKHSGPRVKPALVSLLDQAPSS